MAQQINIIRSTAVPVNIENIDTDQIIPARFLKATSREGFGKNLFRDWRYANDDEAQPKKDFPLNNSAYKGNILIGAKNFGCGSSREHAAWAIKDAGFDVVVSSFFADIFKNNALNNFILPITVSENFLEKIFAAIDANPNVQFEVNLPEQTFTILSEQQNSSNPQNNQEHFDINSYKKTCLLNGFDDIDFLLNNKKEIEAYEAAK